MPFTDVPVGSYYYDAVLWAVENGIAKGTSETMFGPDASCTRAQIVTFLYRAFGTPTRRRRCLCGHHAERLLRGGCSLGRCNRCHDRHEQYDVQPERGLHESTDRDHSSGRCKKTG